MEAIILTGGEGTRLRSVIKDIPKTMADINGKPFMKKTLDYLNEQNIDRVILAVGYKKEYIENFFKNQYKNIELVYSEEERKLDTGGAIKLALSKCKDENVLVMNGDIYARPNIMKMFEEHKRNKSDVTILIKEMENVNRFGIVQTKMNRCICFKEKQFMTKANINVGMYIIKKDLFVNKINDEKFSFEKDYLEKYVTYDKINAVIYDGEFVDIGLPEDYYKMKTKEKQINDKQNEKNI